MTRIAVAGAGIAGLTTALALAPHCFSIDLYDRASQLGEAGAGIQLPPNATRVLSALGVLDRIRAQAVAPDSIRIRRGRDGAELARLQLGPAAERRFGAPFLLAHRADVQAALLAAAQTQPGITITTGEAVEGFGIEADQVAVELRGPNDGRTVAVDGLVGADGLGSLVRSHDPTDAPVYCGRTAWRALVPAEAAPAEARRPCGNLWLGRKAHLVHYPVRGCALVNIVAIVEDDWRSTASVDFWAVAGDPGRIAERFAGWAAEPRALIGAASDWRVWPLFDRPPLRAWSVGPVTLVGDAAHPMLPFLAQGAAQAIRDADALGRAFADHPDVTQAFMAYERMRRPVADRTQRESRRQGVVYHLDGPAAAARDIVLRLLGPARMLERYAWLYGDGAVSTS